MTSPTLFTWDGESMVPRHPRIADRQFVVDQCYPLVVHEERSSNSHRHYFAAVEEGWRNLPENLADRFPTKEHLRKYALVQAGYADERAIVCESPEEAQKVAAFIRPMDSYAVVVVNGQTVRAFTAQSQSMAAMGRKDFQQSKDAVLAVIGRMIGVDPAELSANAARAA